MKHILIAVVILFGIESRLCSDNESNKTESSSAITDYNFDKEGNIRKLTNYHSNYNNVQPIVKKENTVRFTNHHRYFNTINPISYNNLRENVKLHVYSPTKNTRSELLNHQYKFAPRHSRFGVNPNYFNELPNIQPHYYMIPRFRPARNPMALAYPTHLPLQQDNQKTLLNPSQTTYFKHKEGDIYNRQSRHLPINMQHAANIVNGYTDRHYNGGSHATTDQNVPIVGASEFYIPGRKSVAYFNRYSPPGTTGIRYKQQYLVYLPMNTVAPPGMMYQYVLH